MPRPSSYEALSFIDHVCAGGVVVDKLAGKIRIVLIEVSKGRYPQWLLPKGHVNAGEVYELAARREVSEETGIPFDHLDILAYLGKIDYSFPPVPRDELHRKTVHFYLMHALSTELSATTETVEEGISQSHWFPVEAAKEVVRYDGNREIIDRAELILEQLEKKRRQDNLSA